MAKRTSGGFVRKSILITGVLLLAAVAAGSRAEQRRADSDGGAAATAAAGLAPTDHPVIPREVSRLWFAPQPDAAAQERASIADFAAAMKLVDAGDHEHALPLLSRPSVQEGPLGDYARYYVGLADLRLGRPADARRVFQEIQRHRPIGYLAEAAALAEAECAEALDDYAGAAAIYQRLTATLTTAPAEVWLRLGGAAKSAGDLDTAADAFGRVYFEHPLTSAAESAGTEYASLPNVPAMTAGSRRYQLELTRAERLYSARRYAEADAAFERVRPAAKGADRELVALRLGQTNYYRRQLRTSRDGLLPLTQVGPRRSEALYFYALAVKDLGAHTTYVKTSRQIADEFPADRWAGEALNALATHYIVQDDDDLADATFRELYRKDPQGPHAARAAWKVGWRSYRQRRFAETVRYFEQAAADFPRADYRPAWLYWAGRAHETLDQPGPARERYLLTAADYLNSYYGRLAAARLGGQLPVSRIVGDGVAVAPPPLNEPLVRLLLDAGRPAEAKNELRYAQLAWGDSAAIQATLAWINRQQGLEAAGRERFDLLRGSITLMRRAYPQFMAAGGEDLPRDVLTTIFPLSYWDLILKYSRQHDLDPYLLAALMAQESTFVPDVRSPAGAVGLMQLMPATGRVYARQLKLPYSSRLLTNPEANVRMGTAYLADKLREFGGLHLALASYNAGERAVRRWVDERPDVTDRDEFIDDIPYPETQNYVKRILGSAEDYRRLYGSESSAASAR